MSTITQSHLVTQQQYADDTQIHISFSPSELSDQLNTQSCLASLDSWLCENGLALNESIEYKLLSLSLLSTKFLQPLNLAIFTTLSLFKPLTVPAPHLLSLFLAHQPALH